MQALVNFLVSPFLLEPILLKRHTRSARELLLSYDVALLTNTESYSDAVSMFQELTFGMFAPVIDSAIQHLISSAITFAIAATMASAQTRHKEEMLALCEIIEKALLLRESGSSTPLTNSNAPSKLFLPADFSSKSTEQWNQADLGYFDPHLDKAHGESKVISVGKDVYYRNIVLFV